MNKRVADMLLHSHLTPIIKPIPPLVGLLVVMFTRSFAQGTLVKASFLNSVSEPVRVNVLTGQSCLVIFDEPVGRLALSNIETAEAVLVAPDQMMINGKASGKARFTAWSRDSGRFIFFDVDVRANLEQIDSQVRALFPKEDIKLSQANGSVVISGAADPKVAQQVETIVQAAGFKTVNLVAQAIQTALQVQLQLRLVEVSRNKLSELAASPVIQAQPGRGGYFNTGQGPWTLGKVEEGALFGSVANTLNVFAMSNNAFMFLRALQSQGALRALAEPNLIAMNGQQASFLAGGALPIPVSQGSGAGGATVVIEWKEYGVRVNFKPLILDEQHIRLELEPEVSTLDYTNAIRFNGFLIPALRTRRAKTGIELQNAADAAALAGVSALNHTAPGIAEAANRAVTVMNKYGFNGADVVIGRNDVRFAVNLSAFDGGGKGMSQLPATKREARCSGGLSLYSHSGRRPTLSETIGRLTTALALIFRAALMSA